MLSKDKMIMTLESCGNHQSPFSNPTSPHIYIYMAFHGKNNILILYCNQTI